MQPADGHNLDDRRRAPVPEELEESGIIAIPDSARRMRWTAALAAADIPYTLRRAGDGWQLVVPRPDYDRAMHEIRAYEHANRNWPPAPPQSDSHAAFPEILYVTGLPYVLVLLGMDLLHGPRLFGEAFFESGVLDAAAVRDGEIWRILTALTLHGGSVHLLGNLAACFFLFSFVHAWTGAGFGAALILLSGAAGNTFTVMASGPGHRAVGASTAVFGALGMLAVFQFVRNYRMRRDLRTVWHRSWVALAAAVALLGVLGTSPRADLTGHVFGFVAGTLLGLPVAWRRLYPGKTGQRACAVAALVLVVAAWLLAVLT